MSETRALSAHCFIFCPQLAEGRGNHSFPPHLQYDLTCPNALLFLSVPAFLGLKKRYICPFQAALSTICSEIKKVSGSPKQGVQRDLKLDFQSAIFLSTLAFYLHFFNGFWQQMHKIHSRFLKSNIIDDFGESFSCFSHVEIR